MLRELGLFTLENRRLWEDLIVAFQYLRRSYKSDGDRYFSRACCDRMRGNGFILKEVRLRLDKGRNILQNLSLPTQTIL